MRPKARGMVQLGGPPGRVVESDPAGVILYVMDCPSCQPFPYSTVQELPSCELKEFQAAILKLMYTTNRHELRHARKAWPGL